MNVNYRVFIYTGRRRANQKRTVRLDPVLQVAFLFIRISQVNDQHYNKIIYIALIKLKQRSFYNYQNIKKTFLYIYINIWMKHTVKFLIIFSMGVYVVRPELQYLVPGLSYALQT